MTQPQVAGPLVVIFWIAIVPAVLVVPLLCYKYLPMLFGAVVSAAERVVHYGRLKTNEEYRSQFEVGNMKEHPNKVISRWGCLGNLWCKWDVGNSINGDEKKQTKTQKEQKTVYGQSVVHTLCLPVTFAIHEVYFGLFHLLRTSLG